MSSINWPLFRISEPHETNDVILSNYYNSTSTSSSSTSSAEHPQTTTTTTVLLDFLFNNLDGFSGNQRFLELLKEKQEEYMEKTRLEKPLVSVALLKQWRNQNPPGRFLVAEEKTSPPLWKDIGDKKVRSYISKALKYLTSSNLKNDNNEATVSQEKSTQETGAKISQEDNEKKKNDAPIIPRFHPLQRATRSISKALSAGQSGDGKLYGRTREQRELFRIFQENKRLQTEADNTTSNTDVILISGEMGVGKTSLARTLLDPKDDSSEERKGYFLYGKFETLKRSDPTAAFVAAMTDFCNQLLSRNDAAIIEEFRDTLLDSLENDTTLLTNVIPASSMILNYDSSSEGRRSTSSSNSTTAGDSTSAGQNYGALAMQRVKKIFSIFLQIIVSVNTQPYPVVVLLDDLHWANEMALDIFAYLVTEQKSSQGLLFLVTYYQGTEKQSTKEANLYLEKTVQFLEHHQTIDLHSFRLDNLQENDVRAMLGESLLMDYDQLKSLNTLIYSLTKGNPTFIKELLRIFQDKEMLQFDEASKEWQCDFHKVPLTLDGINSVSDLFKVKLQNLPENIQETLKITACLGSCEIDESILQMIDSIGSAPAHLKHAYVEGVLKCDQDTYFFASDEMQQAAYALIPQNKRAEYHLMIGQQLWTFLDERNEDDFLFTLLRQLMMGDSLLENENDRRLLASLCLRAGEQAAKTSKFQTASVFLSHGISILSGQKMWRGRNNYDLALALHNALIEVCYCIGDFSTLDRLVGEVLCSARSFEDSLLARGTHIYALGSRNRQEEAINIALEALCGLKERLPPITSTLKLKFSVRLVFRKVKRTIRDLSDEQILGLPPMRDHQALAKMQIFNHIIIYTFYTQPILSCLVVLRMVDLTITHGLSTISSVAFSFFALLSIDESVDEAYRFGRLALKLYDKYKTEVWLCRTSVAFYGCVYNFKYPVDTAIEPLRRAYRLGLGTGDFEYAMLNGKILVRITAEITRLPELERQARDLLSEMDYLDQTLSRSTLTPVVQLILNLMGKADGDPKLLQGEVVDGDIERAKRGINPCMLDWVDYYSMKLAYLFSDYDLAEKHIATTRNLYRHIYASFESADIPFYESLVLLAQARNRKKGFLRRRLYLSQARKCLKIISNFALHSPLNFLGKQYLIQAEFAVVTGNHENAMSNFRSSVLHSRESGSLMMTALANERMGKYLLERGELEMHDRCWRRHTSIMGNGAPWPK